MGRGCSPTSRRPTVNQDLPRVTNPRVHKDQSPQVGRPPPTHCWRLTLLAYHSGAAFTQKEMQPPLLSMHRQSESTAHG
jgi:hypothetical protein